ncbi:MAG: class I SAM-dependent rRNA methyltransferase [Pirellulaceae bacterium]
MPAPSVDLPEQDIASPPLAKAKVVLLPRKALPFYGRHPWVLGSAVQKVEALGGKKLKEEKLDGEVVDLYNEKNKFVARGFYNSQSRIRVRLFTWSEGEALDETLFRRRIAQAILLRDQLGYEMVADREQTATRLVFSEGDGLSGLVVDRYGDYLVVQATSIGIAKRLEMIVGILQDLLRPKGIILRADKSMAKLEGVEFIEEEHHWGELPEGPLTIQENAIAFGLDLREGQKTGFYLDQRENRRAAAAYMKGRRVLDLFCYTGGFALAAAKLGGATDTLGIDGSKKAIAQAEVNAGLNHLTTCKFEVADAFKTLDRLQGDGTRFDAVVLDPPKFARNRSTVNSALMAYHRVNRQAVDLLEPGGILVTNSCSGSVSREDFLLMLSGVAQKSGRDIQILEVRGAAADHPVSATCLETEYLKCVVCRVR